MPTDTTEKGLETLIMRLAAAHLPVFAEDSVARPVLDKAEEELEPEKE
jgi:hypothetical protein